MCPIGRMSGFVSDSPAYNIWPWDICLTSLDLLPYLYNGNNHSKYLSGLLKG